ncbi:hypothetical protein OS493_037364 [Desmophyllum pertusum]|uniref:Uncharacterized protein n=1 Tax=Desmophyllum pertusum TaxID=174260 RepID=A0A9W9YHW9_9CNID|nr:hypothetical protein OS493_037364 [Desmophyllum pertusum]
MKILNKDLVKFLTRFPLGFAPCGLLLEEDDNEDDKEEEEEEGEEEAAATFNTDVFTKSSFMHLENGADHTPDQCLVMSLWSKYSSSLMFLQPAKPLDISYLCEESLKDRGGKVTWINSTIPGYHRAALCFLLVWMNLNKDIIKTLAIGILWLIQASREIKNI